MPASRRNAATTRLPRSCPSRPILVTSTLGGWVGFDGVIVHRAGGGSGYGGPPPARCEGGADRRLGRTKCRSNEAAEALHLMRAIPGADLARRLGGKAA